MCRRCSVSFFLSSSRSFVLFLSYFYVFICVVILIMIVMPKKYHQHHQIPDLNHNRSMFPITTTTNNYNYNNDIHNNANTLTRTHQSHTHIPISYKIVNIVTQHHKIQQMMLSVNRYHRLTHSTHPNSRSRKCAILLWKHYLKLSMWIKCTIAIQLDGRMKICSCK